MKTIDTMTVKELLDDIKTECKRHENKEGRIHCNKPSDCKYLGLCGEDMYYLSASDIVEGMYKASLQEEEL